MDQRPAKRPATDNLDATAIEAPPSRRPGIDPSKTLVSDLDSTVVGDAAPSAPAQPPRTMSDSAPPPAGSVAPESRLGDFQLKKKLGKGGMGEVWLAKQLSLDRDVALKVMNSQFAAQDNFAKRFIREAQTMAKLDHPNIVRGYAVDKVNGQLFLAMELVKGHPSGRSLQDWMDKLGKLEVGDAIHVVLIIADALQHAQEMNLIHRDIKPDNMLITEKGIVKLSDMGLAKQTDEDMSMTQSGTGLGTPYYMPPEQAADAKHVDHRSDIYALGCTLFYFVTGKLPFAGTSALELIQAKMRGTFESCKKLNPAVPERLDLVIGKMIQKDPKHRYQSYPELARDLTALNLASPSLSFVGAGAATTRLPTGAAPAPGASTRVTPPGAATATGHPARTATTGGAAKADAQWYVVQKGTDGKPRKVKLTTAQIKQMLKVGTFDAKTKACTIDGSEYRPLGTIPEFADAAQVKNIKAQAEKKTEQFNQLYKQIDRQQKWRPWVKWFQGFFDGVKGLISLVIYLAVLAGIGIGVWIFWPTILGMITGKPPASAAATETPAAQPGTGTF